MSITIDLEKSFAAGAIANDNLVHGQQLDKFITLVSEIVDRIPAKSTSEYSYEFPRFHDAITIHGQRGAGKTTFMLTALEALRKDDNTKVVSLGVIDPTLMSRKENILLIILQRIKKEVDLKRERTSCQGSRNCCEYDDWRKMLENLGEGLKTVGTFIGDNATQRGYEETDPKLWINENLCRAKHSADLEFELHQVIEKALQILNQEAFIIGIDDIDTRFDSGWPVLETVRKYLTSPRFMVVLSGDIQLYTALVRKEQYRMFGFDFTTAPDSVSAHKQMIETLVDQYLLKILPPQNQLRLLMLSDYIKQQELELKRGGKSCKACDAIDLIISDEFGIISGELKGIYRDVFFNQPIRSFLRLFDVYYKAKGELPSLTNVSVTESASQQNEFINGLGELYYPHTHRFGFSLDALDNLCTYSGLTRLVDGLVDTGLIYEEGQSLLPRFFEKWHNLAVLPLAAKLYSGFQEDIGLVFAYWVRVCLVVEVAKAKEVKVRFNPRIRKRYVLTDQNLWKDYSKMKQRLHLDLTESLVHTARRCCGVPGGSLEFDSKVELLEKLAVMNEFLALPLIQMSYGEKRRKLHASVLPIIGLMGELLQSGDVSKILRKYFQILTYPLLVNEQEFVPEDEIPDQFEYVGAQVPDSLVHFLSEWKERVQGVACNSAPVLLSRIFIRFYNTIKHKTYTDPVRYIHQCMVDFLYAVLLEEYLFHVPAARVRRVNPSRSAKLLVELFERINSDENYNGTLSLVILSCPLIWGFLDFSQGEHLSRIKDHLILSGEVDEEVFDKLLESGCTIKLLNDPIESIKIRSAMSDCIDSLEESVGLLNGWEIAPDECLKEMRHHVDEALDERFGEKLLKNYVSTGVRKYFLPLIEEKWQIRFVVRNDYNMLSKVFKTVMEEFPEKYVIYFDDENVPFEVIEDIFEDMADLDDVYILADKDEVCLGLVALFQEDMHCSVVEKQEAANLDDVPF